MNTFERFRYCPQKKTHTHTHLIGQWDGCDGVQSGKVVVQQESSMMPVAQSVAGKKIENTVEPLSLDTL